MVALLTFWIIYALAPVAPAEDNKLNGPGGSSMSECPQPKELPTIQFISSDGGSSVKPYLKIQRNFNKVSVWSWPSGGIGPVASNLVNLGTVENIAKTDHSDADDLSNNYSTTFELDETIQLKVGWHAACGGYDYVVDGTRVTCSLCSLFKLCNNKTFQHVAGNETEAGAVAGHSGNGHRHSHHHHSTTTPMRTCAENVVTLLPEQEYTRTSMIATFAVGDIPLSEAKLSIKVMQPNLCLPEKKTIFDMEYQIFPNTFVVVNITGLELGKIYMLVYQPLGHFRFGTNQRVHFRPMLKTFRMPTMSALCSVDGGEEILANQLWPTDNSNRLTPYRPLERLF